MTALAITITPEGIAAAVNAANTGTGPLVITQVALLSAPSTEIKRIGTIGGEAIADNIIHVTITDETTDTYTLTGLRLITDAGIVFATYHQPSPILEKGAQQLVLLSADIVLTSVPAGSVTIGGTGFAYPPATETRQGVIEIATAAEVQAGTDTTRAITPAGLQAAAATTAPAMAGAAAVGTAKRWARADHVHPSDTSKANTSGTYAGLNVGYANSAGNADTVDGMHAADLRAWNNLTGRPTTIAGYGITDALVYNNGSTYGINVTGSSAYAASAGNADTVDGMHAADLRAWNNLTGRPTTIAGYGITDALVYNNGGTYGINISGNSTYATNAGYAGSADTANKLAASPGAAPHYAVRAWVNFNGVGSVYIRNAGNVSSITDLGTGQYRLNFSSAMPHNTYAAAGNTSDVDGENSFARPHSVHSKTVWSCDVHTRVMSSGNYTDVAICDITITC